jgi:transposase
MGRSRGGLTTKIHALVDASGLPIALKLTEGQAHDGRSADDMLGSLADGQILIGDRAYDSDARRQALAERGARANIKPLRRRTNLPVFCPLLYRSRNLVERFFNSSSTSAPSPPATTRTPTTTWLPSNSHQPESGCGLMSRWPRPDVRLR